MQVVDPHAGLVEKFLFPIEHGRENPTVTSTPAHPVLRYIHLPVTLVIGNGMY